MNELDGLTVVIPCKSENEEIVTKTYSELQSLGATTIVVDDGGTMNLPDYVNTISYRPSMGYGYAIKKGIDATVTQYTCTMDGDSQHLISDVKNLYTIIKLEPELKMIVGQRWGLNEKWYRKLARKALNFVASIISEHYLPDLNSGLRIFDTQLAKDYKSILCDTFSFTTSLTMSFLCDGYKIVFFPIHVQPRKYGKSHISFLKDGLVTLYYIIWVGGALRTRNLRRILRKLLGRAT